MPPVRNAFDTHNTPPSERTDHPFKVYIAGKMRGVPRYNFPAFDVASRFVRSLGWEAVNPAEHELAMYPDRETWDDYETGDPSLSPTVGFDLDYLMTWDLHQILDCDGIVLLGGWETSEGTKRELAVARAAGKRVFNLVIGRASEGEDVLVLEEEVPLRPPLIVGLIGFAQVGKDTFAQALTECGWQRRAFADALRDVLYALDPMVDCEVPAKWDGGANRNEVWSLRRLVDRHGWDYAKTHGPEWSEFTARKYLQRLGTEGGRNVLGEDVWVRTVMDSLVPTQRYVITDVRFPDEVEAVAKAGGILIRITRPGFGPVNDHISEHALDNVEASLTIDNAGSIEDLHEAARAVSRSLEGS